MQLRVGEREFRSKSAAKEYARTLLNKYELGACVAEAGDTAFLSDLLLLHPEADQKIGAGIAYFSIELDPEWRRTRCFVVHRTDRTTTDFSYLACVDGPDRRRDASSACRAAVAGQILDWKRGALAAGARCPFTGEVLSAVNCHVDHAPPTFAALLHAWLAAAGKHLEDLAISEAEDNQYRAVLTDPEERENWCAFHREHARLRLVSARANLSMAKRRP